MIIFAAGNYYDGEIRKHRGNNKLWVVAGKRWIKSKRKFSSNALIHCVGEIEPVEVIEAEFKQQMRND